MIVVRVLVLIVMMSTFLVRPSLMPYGCLYGFRHCTLRHVLRHVLRRFRNDGTDDPLEYVNYGLTLRLLSLIY